MFPGILVPIVLFFGLAVVVATMMTGSSLSNIKK